MAFSNVEIIILSTKKNCGKKTCLVVLQGQEKYDLSRQRHGKHENVNITLYYIGDKKQLLLYIFLIFAVYIV